MIASIVVATAAATAATLLASQGLRRMLPLLDRLVLALPTDRSSHTRPTPCGGGVAIVALLVPAIAAATLLDPGVPWLQCAVATVALAWCSWIDDRRGVAPAVRLAVQTAAVDRVRSYLASSGVGVGAETTVRIARIRAGNDGAYGTGDDPQPEVDYTQGVRGQRVGVVIEHRFESPIPFVIGMFESTDPAAGTEAGPPSISSIRMVASCYMDHE